MAERTHGVPRLAFAMPRGVTLHHATSAGRAGGRGIVFVNSLGTDLRIWGGVIERLPSGTPWLAWDKRGHGLSDDGPIDMRIDMDTHVGDVADLMDALGFRSCVICGVSVGGMIAQGLAARRPDLTAALLLSNTGCRIGETADWDARIDAVRKGGIASLADAILERWFSPAFREARPEMVAGCRNMLVRTSPEGYAGTCAAIRDADLGAVGAGLALPVACLAGEDDRATPPAVVADMAARIPGATLRTLPRTGHLPCIEAPEAVAEVLAELTARLG